MKTLPEYLPKFIEAFKNQVEIDNARWGQTWAKRSKDGQEERAYARFNDYYDQWKNAGTPIPWLKIAGEAFIGWVRETKDFIQEEDGP